MEDLKSKFFKLLGDNLYNTSQHISATSVSELQVFLKIWNPIFTTILHGDFFIFKKRIYKKKILSTDLLVT